MRNYMAAKKNCTIFKCTNNVLDNDLRKRID